MYVLFYQCLITLLNVWYMYLVWHSSTYAYIYGCSISANNVLCLRIWKESAAVPIHSLHLGFGIGAMIGPQLARPFISDRGSDIMGQSNQSGVQLGNITDYQLNSSNVSESSSREMNLTYPYSISAGITLVLFTVFVIYYITEIKYRQTTSTPSSSTTRSKRCLQLINPASCASGRFWFGLKLFVLIFFIYLNIVGGERAYSKFLFSFAIESDLELSSAQATYLNSAFWLSFLMGRVGSMIIAKFKSPRNMVIVEIALNIVCSGVLVIWAGRIPMILWMFRLVIKFKMLKL